MKRSKLKITNAKYSIGDLIHHKLFDYRGVIVDLDAGFQLSEDWYQQVAQSRPPKDEPWYHVLTDRSTNMTYVAEQNLEPDTSGKSIDNPMVRAFFTNLHDGHYANQTKVH